MTQHLSVDEMKQIELELMDEFDRICREHEVVYFLAYGSLLGAVRHGGFIPWDDDMDVLMPRADYERFIQHFDEWKSKEHYALASYRDGKSIYPFVKMVDTTTRGFENFVDKSTATGVWVDLFPLEEVDPNDLRPFKRNARLSLIRSFIVADPSVGSSGLVKLVKRIVCPFARRLDPLKYAQAIDENAAQACKTDGSDTLADIIGEGNTKYLFPKSIFEVSEIEFEGRVYLAPKGIEEFLTIQYGDWRTPPDETDREIHTFEAYRL